MVQATGAKKAVTQALLTEAREYSLGIVAGLTASPSHFHAVNYCKSQLASNGFVELKETE